MLAGFSARYPDVKLELLATHVPIDLYAEDVHIALRLGLLPDSTMIARQLASFTTGVYASPLYIQKHGMPNSPEQLKEHAVLALHQARSDTGYSWPMQKRGRKPKQYAVNPLIVASDPALMLDAALSGLGLILAMDEAMVREVHAKRLCRVLRAWDGPTQELNALFPGNRLASPKVRVFIEYLKEQLAAQMSP